VDYFIVAVDADLVLSDDDEQWRLIELAQARTTDPLDAARLWVTIAPVGANCQAAMTKVQARLTNLGGWAFVEPAVDETALRLVIATRLEALKTRHPERGRPRDSALGRGGDPAMIDFGER
jgi:hypothetical protein